MVILIILTWWQSCMGKNGKLVVRNTVILNNLCPLEATNLETELKKWLPENHYGLVTNFRGQFLICFHGPSQNSAFFRGLFRGIYHFRVFRVFRVFRGRWPPCTKRSIRVCLKKRFEN